jgi:hypothetical protein
MRLLVTTFLALLAALQVQAHYRFLSMYSFHPKPPFLPRTIDLNGSGDYDYIRVPDDMYSNGPVTDVLSTDIRCNKGAAARTTGTLTVAAGSTVSQHIT